MDSVSPLMLNLRNIETGISRASYSSCVGFKGSCHYFHYGMQGIDDRGWGCGYRTLQTILSWFTLNQSCTLEVPNLYQIQELLCKVGDKPPSFYRSKEWIGSFECGVVVELLTQRNFRLLHVPGGQFTQEHLDVLHQHFVTVGAPIMMGGSNDNSSKGILALQKSVTKTAFLICDPHFYSVDQEPSLTELCSGGWIGWRETTEFGEHAFYNLCLPI